MSELYLYESEGPISIIPLSTSDGATLNAVWKQRTGMWHIVEPFNKRNIVDRLTPRQFHEAIENGKYFLTW
jgi:hypothetical protein